MAEEKKKDKLSSETLCYLGKLLKKQGTRKDKEGKEVAWKLWHLNFDVGGQYPWHCSAFDTLSPKSVQITDLKEGEYYEIVFKTEEYQHPQYGRQQSKSAVLLKPSSKDKATDPRKHKEQQSSNVSLQGFDEFAKEYNEATKGSTDANSMHMLGAYIANTHPDQFKELMEKCKKNFKKLQLN